MRVLLCVVRVLLCVVRVLPCVSVWVVGAACPGEVWQTPVPVCLAFSSSEKEIGCHEIIVPYRPTTLGGHCRQETG